jgi:hypothetical protein
MNSTSIEVLYRYIVFIQTILMEKKLNNNGTNVTKLCSYLIFPSEADSFSHYLQLYNWIHGSHSSIAHQSILQKETPWKRRKSRGMVICLTQLATQTWISKSQCNLHSSILISWFQLRLKILHYLALICPWKLDQYATKGISNAAIVYIG